MFFEFCYKWFWWVGTVFLNPLQKAFQQVFFQAALLLWLDRFPEELLHVPQKLFPFQVRFVLLAIEKAALVSWQLNFLVFQRFLQPVPGCNQTHSSVFDLSLIHI